MAERTGRVDVQGGRRRRNSVRRVADDDDRPIENAHGRALRLVPAFVEQLDHGAAPGQGSGAALAARRRGGATCVNARRVGCCTGGGRGLVARPEALATARVGRQGR